MTRHIRDPVTGRCKVCDKAGDIHGPQTVVHQDDPNGRPTWDSASKKVIYVNSFSKPVQGDGIYVHNTSLPPRSPSPKPRSPDSGYSADSGVSASRINMYPAPSAPAPSRGPVTVYHHYNDQPRSEPTPVHQDRYRPRERSPPPRQMRERTPSPQPGCCGGGASSSGYGRGRDVHNKGYYDQYGRPHDGRRDGEVGGKMRHGYGHHRNGTNTGGNWGRRRCCAVIWALLILLLLAALAVAIYFIVKADKDERRKNDPARKYPSGYYVNGVWVVPVTDNPRDTYFVYGSDIPCNPYNNNTVGNNNETYPDCEDVTLRYELNNNYTTTGPTTIVVVTTAAATHLSPTLFWTLSTLLSFLFTLL